MVVEILDPDLDLRWLRDIELELEDQMRPAPKSNRVMFSDRIFEAGAELIRKAEADVQRTALQRARMARDGLLIAFLAVCPIRRKNLAALRLGVTLVQEADTWWLVLPDSETKSRRHDHRILPSVLGDLIDIYVTKFWPAFPPCDNALWPSQYGGAMSEAGLHKLVTITTERELGKAIGPHMFRHCMPYTIANVDGSRIGLASAVLQHSDPRTTQKHYNRAHSVESSRAFEQIVSKLMSGRHTGDAIVDQSE